MALTCQFLKKIDIQLHVFHYEKKTVLFHHFRIYWLDRRTIKSSTKTGSDIKSHIGTNDATKSLVYKVIMKSFVLLKSAFVDLKNFRQCWNSHILQDYFCWINGDKLYFARDLYSKEADWALNTIQNSKDVSVFDASLQHNRQGFKKQLSHFITNTNNTDLYNTEAHYFPQLIILCYRKTEVSPKCYFFCIMFFFFQNWHFL